MLEAMFSAVKYSRLGPEAPTGDITLDVEASDSGTFKFDSAFTYDDSYSAANKFRSDSNYNSAFKWNNGTQVSIMYYPVHLGLSLIVLSCLSLADFH